jgi:hypothetical protein
MLEVVILLLPIHKVALPLLLLVLLVHKSILVHKATPTLLLLTATLLYMVMIGLPRGT